MPRYTFDVIELWSKTVIVDAPDEDQAEEMLDNNLDEIDFGDAEISRYCELRGGNHA